MSEDESKKTSLEILDQLETVGDNPRFIWKLFFLCMIPTILNGLNVTSYVYLTDVPSYWCAVPQLENTSWSDQQIRNLSSPDPRKSSCEMYDLDYTTLSDFTFDEALKTSQGSDKRIIPCRRRYFEPGTSSMVVDFDLVCDRNALKSSIQVVLSLGKFLGAVIFGFVSDKYGRKFVFLCGCILYIVSGPLVAFATSYSMVIAGRIGLGAAGSGFYLSSIIILSEIASKRRRASLEILFNMSYPIGQIIVPVVAYFVRDWTTLQLIVSVPAVFTLLFYWLLPESPLWLLEKGRTHEATKYIRTQYNKVTGYDGIDLAGLEQDSSSHPENYTQLDTSSENKSWRSTVMKKLKSSVEQVYHLLRHGELRSRMFIMSFTFYVCNFSYYGLALNVDNFSTDRYLYGFLTGLLEAPSYLLPIPLLKLMGRRHTAVSLFLVGGLVLLLILVMPNSDGINVPLLFVVFVGRLCISGVSTVISLQGTELFPTLSRSSAFGIISIASNLWSMSAPFLVDLVGVYWHNAPSTVFGLLALLAGSFILLLPETKNNTLPKSVEDILNSPKESKVGFHQICRR